MNKNYFEFFFLWKRGRIMLYKIEILLYDYINMGYLNTELLYSLERERIQLVYEKSFSSKR